MTTKKYLQVNAPRFPSLSLFSFPTARKAVKTKHQLELRQFFCTSWTFRNSLNDVETLIFQSSFLIKYLKYFQAKVYYKTKERCSLLKRGSAIVKIFLWSSKILSKLCWNMFSELKICFLRHWLICIIFTLIFQNWKLKFEGAELNFNQLLLWSFVVGLISVSDVCFKLLKDNFNFYKAYESSPLATKLYLSYINLTKFWLKAKTLTDNGPFSPLRISIAVMHC